MVTPPGQKDGRLPKAAFQYRHFGIRDVGRPRVRWTERYSVKTEQAKWLLREVEKKKQKYLENAHSIPRHKLNPLMFDYDPSKSTSEIPIRNNKKYLYRKYCKM